MDNQNHLDNEAELVKRAATDDAAFAVLYDHYFPKIYGYILKRTGSREVAEDLVSDIFMKIFCNLGRYSDTGCGAGPWMYRIATNRLVDYYRKEGKRKETVVVMEEDVLETIVDPFQNPQQAVSLSQDRAVVLRVLSSVPGRYQEILHLKFFAELSNTEIAQALDVSPNNVGVLLHRALKRFEQEYRVSCHSEPARGG